MELSLVVLLAMDRFVVMTLVLLVGLVTWLTVAFVRVVDIAARVLGTEDVSREVTVDKDVRVDGNVVVITVDLEVLADDSEVLVEGIVEDFVANVFSVVDRETSVEVVTTGVVVDDT